MNRPYQSFINPWVTITEHNVHQYAQLQKLRQSLDAYDDHTDVRASLNILKESVKERGLATVEAKLALRIFELFAPKLERCKKEGLLGGEKEETGEDNAWDGRYIFLS